MQDLRLCCVGDSFTAGAGDETALGWPGRVAAAAWPRGVAVTAYNLGVRRDTSADIRRRAEAEVLARLLATGGDAHAVVFCFGANDATFEDGLPRVPPEASRDNAVALLGWSAARWPTLLLGPPPVLHDAAQDARVAALGPVLAAVAAALEVPFLPLHGPLSASHAWRAGAARGDGVHPDAAGYAAMAALVEAWPAWRRLSGG
ncbi:GDSL-type esterase/lipase family protein [Paeniroseomonas aquatica]|uniref:GDSL-type esterase/lipase family protein n=1 Tax=Paeniroseomonas aquatica TaxID=373043 RepID=A0ABT8ADL4_9PROT|nr:GDSL-type esterase/lipase family protein [Paeniroseomonas aquatica]MDN3567745.1 GDSL-type esterase/lipase family protein [Paeniroseomonas aquatica]